MKYLVDVTETYRVDTENEVKEFIEELKKDGNFELKKYASEKKELKQKGDVIDTWIRLKVTKVFQSEKEPMQEVNVSYDYN